MALADVYDALISRRYYKNSWPEEKVLDYIEAEKNKHFDPDIVDAFIDIYDVIKAIRQITQLGLKDAKELAETPGAKVLEQAGKESAQDAKGKLENAGATVELA